MWLRVWPEYPPSPRDPALHFFLFWYLILILLSENKNARVMCWLTYPRRAAQYRTHLIGKKSTIAWRWCSERVMTSITQENVCTTHSRLYGNIFLWAANWVCRDSQQHAVPDGGPGRGRFFQHSASVRSSGGGECDIVFLLEQSSGRSFLGDCFCNTVFWSFIFRLVCLQPMRPPSKKKARDEVC